MHNQIQKRVVMVLGMARCGTSTIARGLQAIGVNLGTHLQQADERNPKGFWEDEEVTFKVNRGLLRELDCHWLADDLAELLLRRDNRKLNEFINFAMKLVHSRLENRPSWGFKDTNTAALLPFWQTVLANAAVEDSYVIALRNPLACAYSNIKHSHLELEVSLLSWLKCMILAIEGSHGKRRVIISYDTLLKSPLHELQRMARDLDFPITNTQEVEHYAKHFVDKRLHHHVYTENDLVSHPAMRAVPLCYRVYALLLQLANDQLSFSDPEFTNQWQVIKRDFDAVSPLYHFVSGLCTENRNLERSIRTIHRSIPWRLLSPLFRLDEYFRARRVATRSARRWAAAWNRV